MHTEYSPKFDIEYSKAKTIGGEYLKAWEDANMEYDFEYDEKGHIVKDSDGNYVYDKSVRLPNRFLYGTLTLKGDLVVTGNIIFAEKDKEKLIPQFVQVTKHLSHLQSKRHLESQHQLLQLHQDLHFG